MGYAPGELEREHLFYAQRANRLAFRGFLMARLSGDPGAYAALVDRYEALATATLNPDLSLHSGVIPEDEFEDTIPPTNQNVW